MGVEVSEELLLPFEHYVIQVLIVSLVCLHLRLAVGVFDGLLDLVLDGVEEEGALARLDMSGWYQLLPLEPWLARLDMRLERVLPHSYLSRHLPLFMSQGTLQ